MAFDEERYAREFIKKLRGGRPLPDDLLERYAITLPTTDAEIAAQLKRVRAFWNKTSAGSSYSAQAARLCRAEDERLQAEHGAEMGRRAWWEERQAKHRTAAQATITMLAEELKRSHGSLGVVTTTTLDGFGAKLSLAKPDAAEAAKQAGLTIVDAVALPDSEPIGNFAELTKCMSACAVQSVPELVHPGAGSFKLLDRYVCVGDPDKRLDVVAVDAQSAAADKLGVSETQNARRNALKILRHALKQGTDLRDVALYHLVTVAREYLPSMVIASSELQKAGLDRRDAAVIAVVLYDQVSASGVADLTRARALMSSGRLGEARQAALALPAGSPGRDELIAQIDAARERLDALLAEVRRAVAIPDEVRAAELLRDVAAISIEDAETAMTAVPLAPPAAVRAVCDGATVKLFWQRAPGHDESTTYVVARGEQRPPAAPGDGSLIHRGPGLSCTDAHAEVARRITFGVFALADNRPSSRPALAETMLLPPVTHLQADTGSSAVTIHWSAHPDAHAVEVLRSADGVPPSAVPVLSNSCQLTGLAEGQTQHFEITVIYRGQDGAKLRSQAAQINATPRSEARPIGKLRARPVDAGGTVRIRVAWTPVDNSDVRILVSDAPPRWQFGSWVSQEEMTRSGRELTGRRVAGRAEVAIEAELAPGVHYLVPFSIGGTGIVVGRSAAVGVTDPVQNLVVTPFASHATVSWEWPATAKLAEVSWEMDGDADCVVIGEAQYRSQGGARVPLGRGPCTIEVRAMIMADGVSYSSPPVRATIEPTADAVVSYAVSAASGVGPFGGRSKRVIFSSDHGCGGVRVRMVAVPGRVMPTRPDGGFVILDASLDLLPGVPVEHNVTVPKQVKRPYWVRCFAIGGPARLVDPPISSLKES